LTLQPHWTVTKIKVDLLVNLGGLNGKITEEIQISDKRSGLKVYTLIVVGNEAAFLGQRDNAGVLVRLCQLKCCTVK